MQIVISVGSAKNNILLPVDELSTLADLREGETAIVNAFRELLKMWLVSRRYKIEDIKNS